MPTNSRLFVDTSGWALYFDQGESDHAVAAPLVRNALRQGRTLLTTKYVIGELDAFLRPTHARLA